MFQVNNTVNEGLLEGLKKIPKIINFTWKDKDIRNNKHPVIQNGLKRMVELNPDWDVVISDDDDIEKYLKENLSLKNYTDIKDRHVVEKTDLWRLVKLYNEGGVYHDLDRYCNVPMNTIITKNVKFVLPTHEDYGFTHCFMATSPENPIFLKAIDDNIKKRKDLGSKEMVNKVLILGAVTWCETVFNTLFDYTDYSYYEENNGVDWRMMEDDIRQPLRTCKYTTTYREVPWSFTMTFCLSADKGLKPAGAFKVSKKIAKKENGEFLTYDQQELFYEYRRDFYDNFKVKHWARENKIH